MADTSPAANGGGTDPVPLGERLLWSTRLLLMVGVVGSVLLTVAVLWLATVDLVRFVGDLARYTSGDAGQARSDLIADVVKLVDTYLLAAILLVLTFGFYELFIGRINARTESDDGPRLLVATSLDDLKDRLAKLVVLILVIEFFQRAIKVDLAEPSDLLALAGGIALVSLAVAVPAALDKLKSRSTAESPEEHSHALPD